MENNIKNIRKSSNTKIIIVSDDKTILEKDIKDLYSDFEELKIISSSIVLIIKIYHLMIYLF